MTPMDMPLDLTVQLTAAIWGLLAALAISGIAVIACTEAPERIRHAYAALVSSAHFRFVVDYVIALRERHGEVASQRSALH